MYENPETMQFLTDPFYLSKKILNNQAQKPYICLSVRLHLF